MGNGAGSGRVFVESQSPGVCHIELTFATGFTYPADVTFTLHPGGVCGGPQCKCGDYLAPTSGPFTVNNPSNTCVAIPDAGDDANGPADKDGGPDAMTNAADGSTEAAGSEAGDANSDAGRATACTDRTSCASGEVCCAVNVLTSAVACQTAPCPYLPGFGPIQLCSSAAECITAGDTCAPFTAGAAGKVCIAPKDSSVE
jgi:hypothetical protein